tara:strand:+ start:2966 stop:3271 length:306 start_codon:yes stop_codon:yes gene_type:complete
MFNKLNKNCTFNEIKEWFEENAEMLPDTLDNGYIYYRNVKFTAELYIFQIESEINRLGKDIRKSAIAKSGKNNLYNLYLALHNVSDWDKPLPKIDDLKKTK